MVDESVSGHSHKSALRSLLEFDSKIRCVVEIGFDGNPVASVTRGGLESLEPERETVRVFDQTAIGAGMGSSMNVYHGRVRVVIVVREKLSLIVFPLFDSLVLVSADPELPLEKIRLLARLLDTTFPSVLGPQERAQPPSCVPTFRELRETVL